MIGSGTKRKYSQETKQRALEQVRIDALQGIPARITAYKLNIHPRALQGWAQTDRQTYQARLSAIHTPGSRFPRDIGDKRRVRFTQMALRRLSLYREEHGITLRPTPWPADDPRRRENKIAAKSKG